MTFTLKLEWPSDPQLLGVVRSTVEQLARVAGFAEKESRSITLAVDEAITNIIRHAYEGRNDQDIELLCRSYLNRLEFLLSDHGRSVDPSELRGRALGEVRPGGLGTHIIAQVMDEVRYEPLPGRNQLLLVKYLRQEAPQESKP